MTYPKKEHDALTEKLRGASEIHDWKVEHVGEVARLTQKLEEWQKAGASVGVNCPGAMQQAKRMAVAACSALGLCYVETAPSDIREAVARLTEALAESEADKVSLYQEARGLRERLAAATELLRDWENYDPDDEEGASAWSDRRDAFLANQPAAPTRTPGKFGYVHDLGDEPAAPTSVEAELAQLRRERDEAHVTIERLRGVNRELLSTRQAAEARCAEMTETAQAAGQRARDAASALADAESELAQLLERVAAAIDAITSARLAAGSTESAWAKQALEALRGQ